MKTFKLVTLTIFHQEEQPSRREEIPLIDGLVINKEVGDNRWIVEVYAEKQYKEAFEKYHESQETLNLQITISTRANDPASLVGIVKLIKVFENNVSILLEGIMIPSKINKAELILTDLIEQGIKGDMLLQEFKHRLEDNKVK